MAGGSSRRTGQAGLGAVAVVDVQGCSDRASDVPLFVDGELADTDRSQMEVHLVRCAKCAAAVSFELAFREKVQRSLGSTVCAPERLESRLRDALRQERLPVARRMAFFRRLWSPMPVAAAGATALGITAWLWVGKPTDDVVREIVARHSRRLPLEIQSSDPQSLEQWLSDKVDFRVKVPRPAGPYHLLGARLSHVRDHSAVYVLFGTPQSPSRHASLIVYDDPSGRPPMLGEARQIDDQEVYVANSAGYNVAVWRENEVVYSLVSDAEDAVLELVRAAR